MISGQVCNDVSGESYLGDRFEEGCQATESYLGDRFEKESDYVPKYTETTQSPLSIYSGVSHDGSSSSFKNDFYTYDKLHEEYIARGSSRIIIYRLDRASTQVDDLTGESLTNEYFKKGIVVQGKYTLNPIIQELNIFGISEDEDIVVEFNYSHLLRRIGRPIVKGDLMIVYLTSPRLTDIELQRDQQNKDYYVRQTRKIYRINTSIPKDTFLYNYVSIEVNAQKTNLDTEVLENENWDDVYELNQYAPDINNENPNPIPIEY